jgi:hypothetical protein
MGVFEIHALCNSVARFLERGGEISWLSAAWPPEFQAE